MTLFLVSDGNFLGLVVLAGLERIVNTGLAQKMNEKVAYLAEDSFPSCLL